MDLAKNKALRILLPLSVLIILGSLLIEVFGSPGIFMGSGYAVAVMITVYSERKRNALLTAAGAIAVILFSIFFLHRHEDFYIATINHLISIAGVLVAMFIVLYVKDIQAEAEKNNKQLISLFNNATEGIIVCDHTGKMVLANPHAEHLFGYKREELTGQKIELLIPQELHTAHEKHRVVFNHHPANRAMGAGRDLLGKRKDGSVFPVEVSLSHYRLGKESFIVSFIIDITVRKQIEAELKKQQDELERISGEVRKLNVGLERKIEDRTMMLRETLAQLGRSKDELESALEKEKELSDLKTRFVSTVSHEFRTPLSTILSSAGLMRKYTTTEEQAKREKHVERIKENVKHMNAMLEDLLSLGKLEEGLVEPTPETFDLHQFMADFFADMEEAGREGQEIKYSEEGETLIATDKRLLRNILSNLVSNAMKFSPENSVIEVRVINKDGTAIFSVHDSGIGISKQDQANLFQRFFRAHNASNIQGTGLGLHIVSKYIDLLGGKITLQSEMEKGSTFTVFIPNKFE